jgi:hypothetical protein
MAPSGEWAALPSAACHETLGTEVWPVDASGRLSFWHRTAVLLSTSISAAVKEDCFELLRLSPLVVELSVEQQVILADLVTGRTLEDNQIL